MSEISLQSYENEIDQLIEQARYVEALAHIRHLLNQSPHYVGAYYYLGKTLLEADLPELAVDMFRRALSADPEHLLSRIGLGLAHERHNDLDGALWNLERALELDPGNADIAEELRRMYGRRDGIELDYVPQTRAGLARLYLRGRLYGRAAEELGALLEDQPARPDLMTALAEAHWRNGQLVQAAEVSQEILDKMPYNCKANLLLGSLWVNGGQEEGWTYLQRAQEVDPANDRASELFGTESLLEPGEVTVDRLAFDPDAIDVDQESTWFRRLRSASMSMGISEAPPEMTAAEMRLVDLTASLEAQIEIPDWLRELGTGEKEEEGAGGLGWMADMGLVEEAAPEGGVLPPPEEPVLLADIEGAATGVETAGAESLAEAAEDVEVAPEWLKELTVETTDLGLEAGEGTPDWLMELVGEQPAIPEAGPSVALEQEITDVVGTEAEIEAAAVDWLSEFALDEEAAVAVDVTREATLVEGPEVTEGEEAIPDWLTALKPAEAEAEVAEVALEAEEIPDWLAELEPVEAEADMAEAVLEVEEIPDWLAELEPAEAEAEVPEVALAAEEPPDWLTELEPAEAEVEAPEIAQAVEETPDWLAELGTPEVALAAEETPDWLAELELSEAEAETREVALAAEEIPDWLAQLEPAEAEVEAELPEVALAAEETPDWLLELESETPEVAEALADVTAVVSPVEEEEGVRSGAAALAWVKDLAGESEEEVPALVEEEIVPLVEAFEPALEVPEAIEEGPAAVEETVIAEEVAVTAGGLLEGEAPTVEGDLLSGDDALAWLESLAAGKEDELRIQVERESERRVAEIMGRRLEEPEAVRRPADADLTVIEAPQREPDLPTEEEVSLELRASAIEEGADELLEVAEVEVVTAESEGVSVVEELLSGEDTLAWLESLTLADEEELQLQAEQESSERVAEAYTEVVPEYEEVQTALPEAPEPVLEAWEEALPTESAPVEAVQAEEGLEALPEAAPFSGEDALAWLEGLTPEEQAELRAQVAEEGAAEIPTEEAVKETVFGWSAFGAEPEEIISPDEVMPEAEEAPGAKVLEELEPKPAAPEVEEVAEAPAPAEPMPKAEEAEVVAEGASVAGAALEPEPVIAIPEAEETAMPSAPQEGAPVEAAPEPELPAPPAAPRAAAEASTATGTDLDEMRAYLKQKRSDHAARLTFARTLWEAGEIAESMEHYGRLVKSGAKSADVTEDLERYAEQRPDGPGVLRTLGDAYMKFGALDKALEIYNRAMHQL